MSNIIEFTPLTKNNLPAMYSESVILDQMKQRGIPKRFLNANIFEFSQYRDHDLFHSQYIYGPVGCGKSRLLAAIGREMTQFKQNNPRWEYISVTNLLFLLRQSYKDELDLSELEIVEKYSSVDVLLLDDLGSEKTTEWSLQTLYMILNTRYEEELITLITSNQTIDELSLHLGERIVSRIVGMCEIVEMKGRDRRL